MSKESVSEVLAREGLHERYLEFENSSATVELAAEILCCEPDRILKSIPLERKDGGAMVIATKGTARVSNQKFKAHFGFKVKFIKPECLPEMVGHEMGGVSPLGCKSGVEVYLDESLRDFELVYPAGGLHNNAVRIRVRELEKILQAPWIDVTQ